MAPLSRTALVVMLSGVSLVACSQPTPYQPLAAASDSRAGYSSSQIETNRYRVSFAGNSMTSRETVETYLLFRAAELTRQQGYDWFEEVRRDTENTGRTVIDQPFGAGRYSWWGPSWRYASAGYGWRSWTPWYGDPFFADTVDVRTIDRYEATSEIVMHRGAKPAGNPRAFDAADVQRTLGPTIKLPQQD